MPRVENVTEIVHDINLDGLDNLTISQIEKQEEFNPNKKYYIIYDTSQNNKVGSLIGLPIEAEQFSIPFPEINRVAYLENINEKVYNIIKFSSNSKDIMVFYDEEKDMIFYRRIFVELVEGFYDNKIDAFWNENNIVKMKLVVLDSNEDPSDDIEYIDLKIMRQGGDSAPVSNIKILEDYEHIEKLNDRKFKIKNETIVNFDLNDIGKDEFGLIRIKATLEKMNVDKWWLTAYLRFINVQKLKD